MNIRQAVPADNAALVELTSLTSMKGEISIRIDRYPDFFLLLQERGLYTVFVAEEQGNIVGSFSAVHEEFQIDGAHERMYYIGDLKVHPARQNSRIAFLLVLAMWKHCLESGGDICFGTAAFGNSKVTPFFDGRAGFPAFTNIGTFHVHQMLPSQRLHAPSGYDIAAVNDTAGLHLEYNYYYQKYRFSPLFNERSFTDAVTFRAIAGGTVRATMSLVDVGHLKQNVLVGLPMAASLVLRSLRIINACMHSFIVPRFNSPIKILYIRAFAADDGFEDALDALIAHARKYAFDKAYSFVTIGIHERDPLMPYFKRHGKFVFKSVGYVTSLKHRTEVIRRIGAGIPFEDYSLI